jgi:hypothetical protein
MYGNNQASARVFVRHPTSGTYPQFQPETTMPLQDDITNDQAAVAAAIETWKSAEAAVHDAQAKLAADQAQLDALAPHLSLFAELEQAAQKYGAEAAAEFASLAARGRALLGL